MIRIWLILLLYAKLFCFCDSSCQYFAFGEAAKLVSQKTGSSSFKLAFSSSGSASSSVRIPKFTPNSEGNFTFLKRTSNSNQEMKCGILFQRSNRQTSEKNIKILDHLLEQTKHIHQQQALSSDSASLTVLLDHHQPQESSSPIHLSSSASFATFYSNGAGVSLGENSVSLLFTANLAILRFEGEEVEHLEQQAREISTSPTRKSFPVKFLQTDLKDGQYLLAIEYVGTEGIHFPSPSPVTSSSSGGNSSSSFSTSASSSSASATGSSDDDKLVRQAMTEPNFSKKVFDWPVFRKNHHQYLKTITHNLIYRLSEGNSSDQRLREIVVMAVIRVPYSPVSTISLPVILVIFVVFLVFIVAFVLQNKSVN